MDTKSKAISMILAGNIRFYLRGTNEIRGVVDHRQLSNSQNELEFSVARRNSAGAWVNSNDYGFFNDVYGEVFENGYVGEGEELLKIIEDEARKKHPELVAYERVKYDQAITISLSDLSKMRARLKRANPDVLRGSLIKQIKKTDSDQLYRNRIKFLEDQEYLLNSDESMQFNDIRLFFNTLDESAESDSAFEFLKTLLGE